METFLVTERQIGEAGQDALDHLLAATAITTVALEETHGHLAQVG